MKIIKLTQAQDIESYAPAEALEEVIKMARILGRPLLLAGAPGTGKTQFAHWYANSLAKEGFNQEVFQFNTKSTSIYNDLFYEYDAVSHFRKAQIRRAVSDTSDETVYEGSKMGINEITAADFITLTALGFAIFCAVETDQISGNPELGKIFQKSKDKFKKKESELKTKSVVLIDEIDKAPRDFPNDLLHEIENYAFTIKEINTTIKLNDTEKQHLVIILTSNDEKNLPNAFLRRCIFYYIDFPEANDLTKIICKKLELGANEKGLCTKMDWFLKICENKAIDKKPSISECIDWINYLNKHSLLNEPIDVCKSSFSILLKKKEDIEEGSRMIEKWKLIQEKEIGPKH